MRKKSKHLSGISTSRLLAPLLSALIAFPMLGQAQDQQTSWQGLWTAAGTPFALRLVQRAAGEAIELEQIESLGFEWQATSIRENAGSLLIDIEYAGVTGTIQVQRQDQDTALAMPLNCTPEYMVVCVLSKGQQALFLRQN